MVAAGRLQLLHARDVVVNAPKTLDCFNGVNLAQGGLVVGLRVALATLVEPKRPRRVERNSLVMSFRLVHDADGRLGEAGRRSR